MAKDPKQDVEVQRFGDTAGVRHASASALAADRATEKRRTFAAVSWLDLKLGIRMFAKFPGLSLVAVGGMALAIAIGAGYFSLIGTVLNATVPIEGGDRVVVIRNRYISGPDAGDRIGGSAYDFTQWRAQAKSVAELGAFSDDKRNLITEDGHAQLVRVATMTASGFTLTGVPPLLGRTLIQDDERPGAAPVVVIAYDQWQRQFRSDANILGRTVRVDDTLHTIVGVMPEGFAFPIRHQCWVPLRLEGFDATPGVAPFFHVFGRIADGFSLAQARAELAAIGERMATAFPQTHGTVRPQVMSYTQAFIGIEGPEMEVTLRSFQIGVALLLLIVAVNVAILVYARTATRFGEITVRTALGATRGRVITQLFIEALVLSVAAAAVGFTLLTVVFAKLSDYQKNSPDPADGMPYWIEVTLSPGVIVYIGVLAVVAGVVIGVLPALKATGKRVQAGLQQFSPRSAAMRLGRTWTMLIVVQVALAVATLPAAIYNADKALRLGMLPPAAAASKLLRGTLYTSREASDARFADRMTTLMQRLEQEPEVSAVTFAEAFPGAEGERMVQPESDAVGSPNGAALIASRVNLVATNLFDVFDIRVLAGRGFIAADLQPGATAVIVDQTFAEHLAPGGNVVGRRVRYSTDHLGGTSEPGRWMEIVGIVPAFSATFTAPNGFDPPDPRLYQAGAPGQAHPTTLIVQVRSGAPTRFGQKLQEITASVDPTMRLERMAGVVEQWNHDRWAFWLVGLSILAVTASVLLLSAAGIYALMSFTVSRRWREIGIRTALGADARRVLMGIFGRASAQIGAGVAFGLTIAAIVEWLTPGGNVGGKALMLFPIVVAVMFVVGLLAAVGPARRGLAIQPTEALRNE